MLYPNQLIQKGSKNEVAVKALKLRLNEVMNSTLDPTNGNFGESTEAVVKQYQKKAQLLDDGVVGSLTWERLFTVATVVQPHSNILRIRAIEIADTQLFVRELTGKNDGKEVEAYLKDVGLAKGYPWCAAFVYWCFDEAAEALQQKNPLIKTGGVLDHWRRTKAKKILSGKPEVGDIFIMDFGKGKGHTGLVNEVKNGRIYTVEGNTSADPAYAAADRDGNGVFERNRPISTIKGFIRYE
jgi:hypothetical protein